MKRLIFLGLEETVAYDGCEWTIHHLKAGDDHAWPCFPFEDYLKANGLAFRSVVESACKKNSQVFTNSLGITTTELHMFLRETKIAQAWHDAGGSRNNSWQT